MSSPITERNAAKLVAALEGIDRTFGELQRATDLGEHECERALNYLKAQGRIENVRGLLHLRPAVTEESSEAPAETDAPAPGESVIATAEFDYAALDKDTAAFVQGQTALIKRLYQGTVRNIVHIGEALLDVREKLVFGEFGAWLEAEFGMSERSARNYMNAARAVQNGNVAELNLPMSALYLLGAPSVPDEVRDDVIARAESGEKLTVAAVKEAIADAKPKAEPEAGAAVQESPAPAAEPAPPAASDHVDRALLRGLLGKADGGKLHRTVLVRQALDAGLTNHQMMVALQSLIERGEVRMDGLLCALVPAESETPPTAPTALDPRATIRVLLAGKPVTRADLWRQFALQDPKVDYAHHLREMALAGEVIIEASEGGALYSLAKAASAAEDTAPGAMIPDSAELELKIVEALRGESMNYHRLLRQTTGLTAILNSDHAHQDNAIRAALNKLAAEQRVHKDDAHLWHLAEEPASPGETTADPTPTSADTNLALLDRAAFEKGLLDLCDQIPGAMRIQGIRSWAALDPEALRTTRALIARTLRAQNDLRVYLTLMDTRLEYMIEHREPYPDPVATPQESPLAQ